MAAAYQDGTASPDHPAELQRRQSAWKLWLMEWMYFILVFASPLGGAVFLRYIRPHVQVYQSLINDFPMALYVLTAYIRPLIHLSRLLKDHAAELKEEAFYSNSDVENLKKRVLDLESSLRELSSLYNDTVEETDRKLKRTLEHSVEPHLKGLNKDIRRTAKKEQRFMELSTDRFRELERRLHDQERWIQEHRAVLDRRQLQQQSRPLLAPAYWVLDSIPTMSSVIWFPVTTLARITAWCIPKYLHPSEYMAPKKQQHRASITAGTVTPPNHSPTLPRLSPDRTIPSDSSPPRPHAPPSTPITPVVQHRVTRSAYSRRASMESLE